jgi:DNA-binding NarL/FixJ family response regulator
MPRVLIVEDQSVVATNLQESLSEMGYDVIDWVPSGEAAIELAQRAHPDVSQWSRPSHSRSSRGTLRGATGRPAGLKRPKVCHAKPKT